MKIFGCLALMAACFGYSFMLGHVWEHRDDGRWDRCITNLKNTEVPYATDEGAILIGYHVGRNLTSMDDWQGVLAVRYDQVDLFELCKCVETKTPYECGKENEKRMQNL